jgi:glycosyltransferase involved in cell wall biosynthesis
MRVTVERNTKWIREEQAALPLVSVITSTFNAVGLLERCMASVQAQDYPRIEHIIVDGASTDGTLDILKQNIAENVRWISEPDKGIYDAWNKGLSISRGEWIAFLGADDLYLPGAVKAYMELATQNPEAVYLSGQVRWIAANGDPRTIGQPWRWPRFQKFMCTAHVGSMHRRSIFEQYGTYDTSYRMTADYELLLRARSDLKSAFLPRLTAEMQGGGATDSVAALYEASRAKIETGRRHRWQVTLDGCIARLKFFGRHAFSHGR